MNLKSKEMSRSSREHTWLPWLGSTGKLRMAWSCWLNRRTYPIVEKMLDNIAHTRRNHLIHWAEGNWAFLEALGKQVAGEQPDTQHLLLEEWLDHAPDYSELFITDRTGTVLTSTYAKHVGIADLNPKALGEGLKANFLYGPYIDPLTHTIGPSSSRFHDAVTLMFIHPITRDGNILGCLCGRIPNDVMSDIIQREAGHVYRDSGDNYLFMIESRFDTGVKPGAALSRSRFEDAAFTLGDNLKQGVKHPSAPSVSGSIQNWSCDLRTPQPRSFTPVYAKPSPKVRTCSLPIPATLIIATFRSSARVLLYRCPALRIAGA